MTRSAIATANSNIALIKYWGKRDTRLNLPCNSSISLTLDEQLSTTTSVTFSSGLKHDEVIINGRRAAGGERQRVVDHVNIIRRLAGCRLDARVISHNTFPAAAGLASSASAFAALTAAAAEALQLRLLPTELSRIARLGSGSATRSVLGGMVFWEKGIRKDGRDSFARQVLTTECCKKLRDIVVIVSERKKKTSSRAGMQATVRTSRLYRQRLRNVDTRIRAMRGAIAKEDLEAFLSLVMEDSDEMHATMLDSRPRLDYLSSASHRIKDAIKAYNNDRVNNGRVRAAYSFDAGPNAHIITTKDRVNEVKRMMRRIKGVRRIIVSKVGNGVTAHDTSYAVVRARGKVLVSGGYAILEGGRGLVLTVDKGTTTRAGMQEDKKIIISIPNLNIDVHGRYTSKGILFQKVTAEQHNKLRFAIAAIKEAIGIIEKKFKKKIGKKKKSFQGVSVESVNDDAVTLKGKKTGLGSSAAAVVSIIAALLDLYGIDVQSDAGRRIVFEAGRKAHRRAQGGLGSGFDIAASCFGTHFFQRKGESGGVVVKKAKWPKRLRAGLAFSGRSADTRALIGKVMELKKRNPEQYRKSMKKYVNATLKTRTIGDVEKNMISLSSLRKELGRLASAEIETDAQTKLLGQLRKKGAALACFPGAGGGDSVFYAAPSAQKAGHIRAFLRKKGYASLNNIHVTNERYQLLQ